MAFSNLCCASKKGHASILAGASEDMNKYRFCGSAHAEFTTGTSSLLVLRSGEISF